MVTEGRKPTIPLFPWKVLIVCVCSHGTCVFSEDNRFKVVTSVSPSEPPRQIWPFFASRLSYNVKTVTVQFVADRMKRSVCLQQLEGYTTIGDRNIELKISDEKDEKFLIKKFPSIINRREYCSTSRCLEFALTKINETLTPNPDLLYINLQILHMESPYRVIHLEDTFCDDRFKLANSRVQVYGKYPADQKLHTQICPITFVKVWKERRLCLFYKLRSQEWAQRFDWEIYVTFIKYSLSQENILFKLNARNESLGKWCDASNAEEIMLIYKTNQSQTFQSEPPVFRMLVLDLESHILDNESQLIEAASVAPWWSVDPSPTQSTTSQTLFTSSPLDFSSSHSLAIIVILLVIASIVVLSVLLCLYLAYTRQPRTNTHEETATHRTESALE
ncbi:hypothetical protein BgiBS90_015017 [Biomphalaria glabrata]|nr:hypothetical protein BgiBS90_015017 [Biomphalaria glabrata]